MAALASIIDDSAALNAHIHALCEIEPRFAIAYRETGPIELRTRPGGYGSLVRTIVGQQVSVASADALWKRLGDAGYQELAAIRNCQIDELRAHGLSRQKASYLISLAEAEIDFAELPEQCDEEIIETLTAVKGIGTWSAEIYLMFALRRADVTAAGDLALQESAKLLFELDERPKEAAFRALAQNWSPYRNAASQLLWAYYHVVKGRAGI